MDASKQFYTAMFAADPVVEKDDYARWEVIDPPLTLALSDHAGPRWIDHVGIKVETEAERAELRDNLRTADIGTFDETDAECCYSKSDKHWVRDPQNVVWEVYRTMESIATYGSDTTAQKFAPKNKTKAPLTSGCCETKLARLRAARAFPDTRCERCNCSRPLRQIRHARVRMCGAPSAHRTRCQSRGANGMSR